MTLIRIITCNIIIAAISSNIVNAQTPVVEPTFKYIPDTDYRVHPAMDTKLVLKLSERKLYLYSGGTVVRSFIVAVGKKGWETPVGNFTIRDKIKNPAWTSFITGRVVKPGKNNPLGTRWIEFYKFSGKNDVIGFHGTTDSSSIGKAVSYGCVRMYGKDVEELYEMVVVGTDVSVVK